MNPDLERLVTLQALDLDLKHLREQLAEAPRRVLTAEAASKQAAAALARAKDSLATEEALRRRHESDIEDRRAKILRLRRQLDAATSTTQVTAYEYEIAFAIDTISKLEDDELSSMERTETLEGERALAFTSVEMATARLTAEQTRSAEVTSHNTAAITAVHKKRIAVRGEIGATGDGERLLATYDRVSKSKGTGISEAVDHKCSACQMLVRPQRWNDLTGRDHRDEIFTCETCGRMLFWDPRRDTPGPWPPGDRLAAARQG